MAHIGVRTTRLLPPRPGLGQWGGPVTPPSPTVPSDPLAARLAAAFGAPLVGALSSRIAYGGSQGWQQYGYGGAGGGVYSPYGGAFGGISQSTLLIGALALGAVLIFSKS